MSSDSSDISSDSESAGNSSMSDMISIALRDFFEGLWCSSGSTLKEINYLTGVDMTIDLGDSGKMTGEEIAWGGRVVARCPV